MASTTGRGQVFSAVTAAAVACKLKAVTVPRWQSSADAAYSPDRLSYKEALDDIIHFVTGPTALEQGHGLAIHWGCAPRYYNGCCLVKRQRSLGASQQ